MDSDFTLKDGGLLINRVAGALLALAVMLALKYHYSLAGPEGLKWMLAPVARLTAWISDTRPVWESGVGYTDFSRGMIIAPACAGINFMIMAFGLGAFCGLLRIRRLPPLLAWLGLCLAGAYILTLMVNPIRIALAGILYQADFYAGWVTPERVHRIAGSAVYLGALGLFFKVLQPIIIFYGARWDGHEQPGNAFTRSWRLPVGWYLLGAVGVPTANLLFKPPLPAYGEHCLTVIAVSLALAGAMGLVRRFRRSSRNGQADPSESTESGYAAQGADCGR